MVQIRPPKNRTTAAKDIRAKNYVNRLPKARRGQQIGVGTAGGAVSGRTAAGRVLGGWADTRWLGGQKNAKGGWYMGQETNAALRRKLRTQRAAYEELLGLAGAIMAALCVRRGDGGTLRLPKQDVHDALTRYEFAAAAEGEDYVLSYRERGT